MVRKIDIEELKKLLNDTDSSLVRVARSFLEDIVAEHEELSRSELYNKGLNDAWELAQKINVYSEDGGLRMDELKKIFDETDTCKIMCLSYEEALAKLKAYEEQSKIEVGDVVEIDCKALVIDMLDEEVCAVLTEVGCNETWALSSCKKTGKHIDIQSVLEQIGGE